jgi:hypothetical protein
MMAGWMNRKQRKVIEYLLVENQVLKQQLERKRPGGVPVDSGLFLA